MNALDCFEKELNIGDTVAYPVRKGSSMWINSGKIINIFEYILPSKNVWFNSSKVIWEKSYYSSS